MNQIDTLLEEQAANPQERDWAQIIQQHLIQIQFFQHERLVHLIVTVLFAWMTTLCLVGMVISFHISLVILLIPLLILLFPYISHYYLLENGVQKMYRQYDSMAAWQRRAQESRDAL